MVLNINPSGITISVKNMAEMVLFYNSMFQTEMTSFEAYENTFYEGKLGGLKIVFCPMEVSGIVSERTRHQLNFGTDDIKAIVDQAEIAGGKQQGNIVTSNGKPVVAIADPDGNTLEFTENIVQKTEPAAYTRRKGEPITSRPVIKPAGVIPETSEEPVLNVPVIASNEVIQDVVTNLGNVIKDAQEAGTNQPLKPGLPKKKAAAKLNVKNPGPAVKESDLALEDSENKYGINNNEPAPVLMNKFATPPAYDEEQLEMDSKVPELAGSSALAVAQTEEPTVLKAVPFDPLEALRNMPDKAKSLTIHENEPILSINDNI